MKGLNTGKIVAMAAGAVLLGSSVVAANVMWQNTELVNNNGEVVAKVVVGSNAAISDGVAAANIAANLANMAYKSSTLSAKLSGDAKCTAGGSASGVGTCEVSDKKVTLDIEVPGVLGNAYQFKTLITDTIDKTLGNRNNTLSEDNYTVTPLDSSDVSTILSPLRGSTNNDVATNVFRIGGSQYSGFATKTITDSQAGSNFAYQVEQGFWVGSSADAVKFDSSNSLKQVVASPKVMAYNLRFLGNDYGIPFCTKADEGNASSGNWAWCNSDPSSQYRTDNHRLTLPFLGSEWVISEMGLPGVQSTNSSTLVTKGGYVKLAKEAKYDIVNVGGELDAGTMKVRLADISVATGASNAHPAILDVLDAAGAVIGQIQVDPGTTYTFTQSGTSNQIKVHVYRTAPGFTLNAKWAEVAIYTDEIILQDGQRYNLASSTDPNGKVKVSLLWKNKDYVQGSMMSNQPDSLREIVLYDIDTFVGTKKLVAGDTYDFPKDSSAFRVTYNGLDLTDANYVGVSLSSQTASSYPMSADGTTDCSDVSTAASYSAKLISFTTNGNNFGSGSGTDMLGTYKLDNFLYDPIGGTWHNATSLNTTLNGAQATNATRGIWRPVVLYKPNGYSCYLYTTATATTSPTIGTAITPDSHSTIRFDTAGVDSGAYGLFYFTNASTIIGPSDTSGNGTIFYQEDAGKVGTASHYPVLLQFPFVNVSNDWRFKSQDSSTANVYYAGIRDTAFTGVEPTLYTERGSKVTGIGTTSVDFAAANTIGQPTFTFSPVSTDGSAITTGREEVLKEGESVTLTNGVKITVKKISETVGSCVASTSGGSAACTPDTSGMSAVISPDNKPTVEAITPMPLSSALVMTDKNAGSASVIISVGGPAVNTVSADALQSANVDLKTTNVVVTAVGNKIVVAGYSAADTMTAAEQFIAGISKK